jgi:hypothetical protein
MGYGLYVLATYDSGRTDSDSTGTPCTWQDDRPTLLRHLYELQQSTRHNRFQSHGKAAAAFQQRPGCRHRVQYDLVVRLAPDGIVTDLDFDTCVAIATHDTHTHTSLVALPFCAKGDCQYDSPVMIWNPRHAAVQSVLRMDRVRGGNRHDTGSLSRGSVHVRDNDNDNNDNNKSNTATVLVSDCTSTNGIISGRYHH